MMLIAMSSSNPSGLALHCSVSLLNCSMHKIPLLNLEYSLNVQKKKIIQPFNFLVFLHEAIIHYLLHAAALCLHFQVRWVVVFLCIRQKLRPLRGFYANVFSCSSGLRSHIKALCLFNYMANDNDKVLHYKLYIITIKLSFPHQPFSLEVKKTKQAACRVTEKA